MTATNTCDLREERDPASRPVWLVTETGLDAWLSSQSRDVAAWVQSLAFKADRHRLLVLPGADGRPAGAVLGLGRLRAAEELSHWLVAGLPDRLPAGPWHIATQLSPEGAVRAALGWALGTYRYERYRKPAPPRSATLHVPGVTDLSHIRRAAAADALARDLVNTPAQDMGPPELAEAARSVAGQHGAEIREVIGEALLTEGLPAIHAVGRAGPRAPRLIDLKWGDPAKPRVTVVGKGVCFDTGGLDLKPAQAMALMKKDMGGAAMALGLAQMVMDAGLPVRLRVLIPAVENSVASNSYRPGDVLATRKGLRVEVGNTDAEGRLVLCDALALADEENPDLLVDLATLTGAARVALGPELPAVYSPDDDLVASLELCSRLEGDPLWHMPLWTPYDEDLSSKVADLANVAAHAFAGSVMAALFLRRFVAETTRWAHVDLFAWNTRERPGRPVGAESQAMRAIHRLIASRYPG
jgi:leucyl aminopeptidase